MSISISARQRFNNGKSSIVLAYSHVNQQWLTWREDSGHQATLRLHPDYEEGHADYVKRIDFLREIGALPPAHG